jgi:hypothetical protein
MKQLNITIHPFSALAGMALLGLVWVTAGAMPLQGSSSTRDVSAIDIVSDPHPRDFVRIVKGSPYTVPAGKVLVVKQLGLIAQGTSTNGLITLSIDGVVVATSNHHYMNDLQLHDYEPGLAAQAGSQVAVATSSNYPAGALGYLVDA